MIMIVNTIGSMKGRPQAGHPEQGGIFRPISGLGTVRIPVYYRPNAELEYRPVTAIGGFFNCASLAGITIPASVTSIGGYAFFNWAASQTIYVKGRAGEAEADAAWYRWRDNCNAAIVYQGGS